MHTYKHTYVRKYLPTYQPNYLPTYIHRNKTININGKCDKLHNGEVNHILYPVNGNENGDMKSISQKYSLIQIYTLELQNIIIEKQIEM